MSLQENLPINLEHLQQLSDGDREFELELLQVFVEDTHSHLEAAKAAIVIDDYETLAREVHQIKGASGNVGAEAMQVLAQDLEQQAQTQELRNPIEIIKQLAEYINQIETFMRSYS